MTRTLSILVFFVGLPASLFFGCYSLVAIWLGVTTVYFQDPDIWFSVAFGLVGLIGLYAILCYWASVVILNGGSVRPKARVLVLTGLLAGAVLSCSFAVFFRDLMLLIIFAPPVILALIHTMLVWRLPSGAHQHNKGFNRTPESSAAAKPGELSGGAG